jgi:hypothetical protein
LESRVCRSGSGNENNICMKIVLKINRHVSPKNLADSFAVLFGILDARFSNVDLHDSYTDIRGVSQFLYVHASILSKIRQRSLLFEFITHHCSIIIFFSAK